MYKHIHTDSGDEKSAEKASKKTRKCSKEQTILMIFEWLLCIKPPDQINVSEVLYQALRWNPDVRQMTRTDQNAVMLHVFKTKGMISSSLRSTKLLLEEFERRSMVAIDQEINNNIYLNGEIDRTIQKLVYIMKSDITEINRLISPHIRNKDLKAHQIFFFLNKTAKKAVDQGVSWMSIASQNALADILFAKARVPLEQFLINEDIGFDEDQYKIEEERMKERNLASSQLRQQIALQHSFMRNFSATSGLKDKKRFKPQTGRGNNKFKEMIDYHNAFLKEHMPNIKWSMKHCGFWNHPTLSCRFGDKCNRAHTCPNCEGSHILKDCPELVKATNT